MALSSRWQDQSILQQISPSRLLVQQYLYKSIAAQGQVIYLAADPIDHDAQNLLVTRPRGSVALFDHQAQSISAHDFKAKFPAWGWRGWMLRASQGVGYPEGLEGMPNGLVTGDRRPETHRRRRTAPSIRGASIV